LRDLLDAGGVEDLRQVRRQSGLDQVLPGCTLLVLAGQRCLDGDPHLRGGHDNNAVAVGHHETAWSHFHACYSDRCVYTAVCRLQRLARIDRPCPKEISQGSYLVYVSDRPVK
jgi:hypothetical protein